MIQHLFFSLLQGHVIMNTQPPSFYQRVIDKTKGLAFQSQFIAQNIDKKKAALYPGTVSRVKGKMNLIRVSLGSVLLVLLPASLFIDLGRKDSPNQGQFLLKCKST